MCIRDRFYPKSLLYGLQPEDEGNGQYYEFHRPGAGTAVRTLEKMCIRDRLCAVIIVTTVPDACLEVSVFLLGIFCFCHDIILLVVKMGAKKTDGLLPPVTEDDTI